jgi:hypothetical protein
MPPAQLLDVLSNMDSDDDGKVSKGVGARGAWGA